MEQIVMSLALDYARARGLTEITDKALDYAYEKLGIQEEEDDEYTVEGIYGMKNAFNTKNLVSTLGRNVLSNAAKNAISSSGLSGILGLGGALMLGRKFDATRPGSRNYNPNLQNEIDYATRRGYIGTNPGSGLGQYGPTSALVGQNVKSMFGTNSYVGQLQNKLGYFKNRIALGKPYSQKAYGKALAEAKALEDEKKATIQEDYRTNQYNPSNGGNGAVGSGFDSDSGLDSGSGSHSDPGD